MKPKTELYDYSELSAKTIFQKRYRHILLLLFWAFYFPMYVITEKLIPLEACHVIHCHLDDVIPFNEYWAFFYCFWYLLVFGSLAYTLFFDVRSFTRLQLFIGITQVIAMTVYVIYPSRQELRPEFFERDNLFTRIMALIYAFDTPSGVCPSLHVGYSCAVVSCALHSRKCAKWMKPASVVLLILISLSTSFTKQHSMVDVFFGLLTGVAAEVICWLALRKNRFAGY